MKFRDREKQLLVDVFVKTAEYVLSIVVLGSIISGHFSIELFLIGIGIFIFLVIIAIFISSKIKDSMEDKK
ncbi:MAG: hypothetical protein HY279_06580 [Nitrospinae bacterium]|nr:hypothetical protein [Nitrospinota bacterium]